MNADALVKQRCFNHLDREAVAKCPSCSRFYCRECITPHEDRLICAACLKKEHGAEEAPERKKRGRWLLPLKALAACLLAWIFFAFIAEALLKIPSSFHDGQTFDEEALQSLQDL